MAVETPMRNHKQEPSPHQGGNEEQKCSNKNTGPVQGNHMGSIVSRRHTKEQPEIQHGRITVDFDPAVAKENWSHRPSRQTDVSHCYIDMCTQQTRLVCKVQSDE